MTGTIHGRIAMLGLLVAIVASAGWADEGRKRTLTYDVARKELVEIPPPPAGTPAGDLHLIRTSLAAEDFRKAIKGAKRFVKDHSQQDTHFPDVLVAQAEALIGLREYHKAHTLLVEYLDRFAGMEATSEALRLEFVIAEAYLGGAKRKFMGLRVISGVDTAFDILDGMSVDHPNSPYAQLALKTKGDYFYRRGEHALAELEYARLLRDYPDGRYAQYALARSSEAALASFGGVPYDDAALIEAEERYLDYLRYYPGDARREGVELVLESIKETRARKEFEIGQYYERTEHLGSAVFYYESVLTHWPDTVAAIQARQRLELLGVVTGEKTPAEAVEPGVGSS